MRTVDLFAGCGGLSLGLQKAKFNIVGAFEYWKPAFETYSKNFAHPVYQTDLSDVPVAIKQISLLKPNIIVGGPPCQDFSQAGKRVEGSRANLTKVYAEIVQAIKPEFFIMENVDRAQKSESFKVAREIFKNSGYGLTEIVLDASLCGVPQKRKRFVCIGALGEKDDFCLKEILEGIAHNAMTLRDYFGNRLGFEYYYRHPRNYSRRAIFSIDEPAPTMRGVYRPVPKGYPGHPNDAAPLSDKIKALTTRERAMIQTFPDNFVFVGNKTDTEQMIGNAVPVELGHFIGEALNKFILNKQLSRKADFLTWLSSKGYSERSCSDIASRTKRAQAILPFNGQDIDAYLFELEKQLSFQKLSKSVQSQIKRAVKLNNTYLACA